MKTILTTLLFGFAAFAMTFAQTDPYEKQWKEVDEAVNKSLPKSALELVEKIYARAKAERNQAQTIKAICYRVAFQAQLNENGEVLLINSLKTEAAEAAMPAKAILQSLLAQMYWQYYQGHRWQIAGRTNIQGQGASEDFRMWDARTFFDSVRTMYMYSIGSEAELQNVSVKDFSYILVGGGGYSPDYRPTLYDILTHRVLTFLAQNESQIPKPVSEFELDDTRGLGMPRDFVNTRFTAPDPEDQLFLTVLIYQRLTAFHLKDVKPEALMDLTMERMRVLREKCTAPDKDTMYKQVITGLASEYSSQPVGTMPLYELARLVSETGDHVKTLELCDQAIARFPDSRGAIDAKSLRNSIFQKSLSLHLERAVLPNAPILASVGYRNLDKVYCRLIKLETGKGAPNRKRYSYSYYNEDEMKKIVELTPMTSWDQSLPLPKDFAEHTADVKLPSLDKGRYLLLMSPDKNFSTKENAIVMTEFDVTRLSLHSQAINSKPGSEDDGGEDADRRQFFVFNSETGKPMEGVTANLYIYKYDNSDRGYRYEFWKSMKTDANGSFVVKYQSDERNSFYVELMYEGDYVFNDNSYYVNRRYATSESYRTMFFTDRSIYRPGQTVYFKGIIVKQNFTKPDYKTVSGLRTTVTFYDANSQKVAEQTLTTNEYGSFNGTFVAPMNVLLGQMTIRSDYNGYQAFRVEEYKRPKFEVSFKPFAGEIKLGEKITAKGSAMAYAGQNIDGADVKYRVVREARFPYWFDYGYYARGRFGRRFPSYSSDGKEIAHGTAKTDGNGEFTVTFDAVPDKGIPRKNLPQFVYTVYADVTDLTGETRSSQTSISLGYNTLNYDMYGVAGRINTADSNTLRITCTNAGGEKMNGTGKVKIERLVIPKSFPRERYVPFGDQNTMTVAEFHKAFPYDQYSQTEDTDDSLAVESVILDRKFTTSTKGGDSVKVYGYTPGKYRITMEARDPSGDVVFIKRYVTVYSLTAKSPAVPSTMFLEPVKTSCQPGQTAEVMVGTSYDDATVLFQVEQRGVIIRQELVKLSNEQRIFSHPIVEEFRGGITMHFTMVKNYRSYTMSSQIDVPWSNKALKVETSTFRDKLLPGAKEEWRLTIKGPGGDKIAAEMVATMYDASLDALYGHSFSGFGWPSYYAVCRVSGNSFGDQQGSLYQKDWNKYVSGWSQYYDELNLFRMQYAMGGYYGYHSRKFRGGRAEVDREEDDEVMAEKAAAPLDASNRAGAPPPPPPAPSSGAVATKDGSKEGGEDKFKNGGTTPKEGVDLSGVKVRTNLNETAFFFPDLHTNEKGEVVLSFTMPEALTKWKLMTFSHTPDMKTGMLTRTAITQKDLMVVPNSPRFVREGDTLIFPAKISNLSDKDLKGTAKLQLFDATTMQPVDAKFNLALAEKQFTVQAKRSTGLDWKIVIPEGVGAVTYRVVASTGSFSDGEESALPVLSNRMLVTETMPMYVRGNQTKTFKFVKLVENKSPTLRNHKLTLEMTSNPAWYAIQALPYMMEYPWECSEQTFNRYYANSIASYIVNSNPKIKRVFEAWKGTDALKSNLEKNEELKSALLQETPWVLDGQDESERKKRVALLFDLNRMANELGSALKKLEQAQYGDGGFTWFPGMPPDRFITQYIVAGIGHLQVLGIKLDPRAESMAKRALQYIDREMDEDYDRVKRLKDFDPKKQYIGYTEIQYLYARSFFAGDKIESRYDEAFDFWMAQAKKYWTGFNQMSQGMIALGLQRFGEKTVPNDIVKSLRERSLHSDEMGMYWKYEEGWWWYQAPIETQAMMVEVFDEVAKDKQAVDELNIWLLKQKQTTDWKTTKATAEACYALLRRGTDVLASDKIVEVTLGNKAIDPTKLDGVKVEAGTGYYKTSWTGGEIKPEMGEVTLKKSDDGIAWGALYWQYFETLNHITPHASPLAITKQLFRRNVTDKGVIMEPITEKNVLKVGDIVKVRIEIRTDRDMEYVHLKDMRGAGLEPMAVLSGYRWQGGLGYYQTVKDASMNFFIGWLSKGVYVFEYSLRVTHVGTFSNGITTIQSMYAPEFASHSEGVTVTVR